MTTKILISGFVLLSSTLAFAQSGPVYNFQFFNGDSAGKNAPPLPMVPGQQPAQPAPVQVPYQAPVAQNPAQTQAVAQESNYKRGLGFMASYDIDQYTGANSLTTSGAGGGIIIPLGGNFYITPKFLIGSVTKASHNDVATINGIGTNSKTDLGKGDYKGFSLDLGKDFAFNDNVAFGVGAYYKNIMAKLDSQNLKQDEGSNMKAYAYGLKAGPKFKGKIFELAFSGHYGLGNTESKSVYGSWPNSQNKGSTKNYGGSISLAIDF